ncbi:MAG: hypothetical protein ABIN67_02040 [Ferruginibacter sp.]
MSGSFFGIPVISTSDGSNFFINVSTSGRSLIYKNIFWYRLLMQIIYRGKYRNRFDLIIKHIPTDCKSILELCFGDLLIAKYCEEKKIHWTGYDINNSFVENAVKRGYDAELKDVIEQQNYPEVDMIIMIGSLYHFYKQLPDLFLKMTRSSNHIIISEPIKNFSSMSGPIGYLARKLANAGKGEESFRFNKDTLLTAINSIDFIREGYKVNTVHQNRDLIIELWRN